MRLLAFTILFTPILFGQQLFFDNTLTGLSASYCYSANNYAYNNTGNFIISAGSHFDFGISFSKSTVNEPPLTMNGIMPNISYTFRKQGRLGGVRLLVGLLQRI